jgi:hypothetical protein
MQGALNVEDLEQRLRLVGIHRVAYLDGGSSVALYIEGDGAVTRRKTPCSAQLPTETVTSYLVFDHLP